MENELIAYTQEFQKTFEVYIFRPGFVLAKETNMKDMIRGLGPSVGVDILARAMVNVALNGKAPQIVENSFIKQLGYW